MNTRRQWFFTLLVCGSLGAQQPAPRPDDPNAGYRTKEGRDRVATTLDNPSRAENMRLRDLVGVLKLKPGDSVADIGAGTGVFIPLLSQAVGPTGRVYAQDIFPDFLERIRDKVTKEKLGNVTLVLGSETSPMLPAGQLAVAVTIDAYHHFDHPREMLAGIREALAPGGRLAIVDFHKHAGPGPGHIRKDRAEVVKEVEANGFRLESDKALNDSQYTLIFARK
jgi:ubiquinone/menaquinone biosynthesis C-methylase UbiE